MRCENRSSRYYRAQTADNANNSNGKYVPYRQENTERILNGNILKKKLVFSKIIYKKVDVISRNGNPELKYRQTLKPKFLKRIKRYLQLKIRKNEN